MIAIEQSETKLSSRLPTLPNAQVSDCLERITGADFLVSPASFPARSEASIRLHLERGAVLVQRKSGRDMVVSITDGRLNAAVARMQAIGARRCCILASGVFLPYASHNTVGTRVGTLKVRVGTVNFDDSTDRVEFRWHKTKTSYSAFTTAKRHLPLRGCWLEVISCDDEIPTWLKGLERDLIELSKNPVKEIFPILQKVSEVKDARTVLAALDNIGPVRSTQLWDAIKQYNTKVFTVPREPNLGQMLVWATMEDESHYGIEHPWPQWVRDSVRAQIPLEQGQDLQIVERTERKGVK